MASASEVGRYIATLRERADLKQVDLARKVTWSQAVLSRVEAGEREVTKEELRDVLDAIGTTDAQGLLQVLSRQWELLPTPPLGHPDQDLLWSAESVAQEIRSLRDRPDVKHVFERRLSEYLEELSRCAGWLLAQDYQVAFIGSIGVGKSTAICRMTGLELPGEAGRPPISVLEAGAGGVTVCEVHLRTGSEYGIVIEPRTEDELRRDVIDFAELFVKEQPSASNENEPEDEGVERLGLSKEIARAVRNMSGLGRRKSRDANGKTVWHDEAKALAETYKEPRALAVEILARMKLHLRDHRDIWYPPDSGKPPLQWLKETFELINNGRHPDFSLPRRIEVVVTDKILPMEGITVRLVDTKGIDQTAERADLECHFDAPHTISVLCTPFNNAPSAEIQLLLTRANEAGVRNLPVKAALLALPRPEEALAVKDDIEGATAKTVEDGCDLKADQIQMQLGRRGLEDMAIGFFNAREDTPEVLKQFLLGRIGALQKSYRSRLSGVIESAQTLLINYEKEQVQTVLRAAAHKMLVWADNNKVIGKINATLHDSLLNALGRSYASTVRATVNRSGAWYNLDYAHHLGYGARRVAALATEKKFDALKAVTENLMQDPELVDAKDFVEQAVRITETSIDELLQKVQLMGQAIYASTLKSDQEFWNGCVGEWGSGPGYRDRVASRNRNWFDEDAHQRYENMLRELLDREWGRVLERLSALCHVNPTEG